MWLPQVDVRRFGCFAEAVVIGEQGPDTELAGLDEQLISQLVDRAKTVLTDVGPVEITVPRDRDGSFEPKIVKSGRSGFPEWTRW
jgi:hypothetical protein